MTSNRLISASLGLLLTASGLILPAAGGGPGAIAVASEAEALPPLDPPTRAEVDGLIGQLGTRVASFYPARTKLREYLDRLEGDDRQRVLDAIRDALPRVNKVQRFHIVRMLGDWGKPEGMALIAPYVTDRDDSVQRAAISGVSRAQVSDPAVLAAIRPLIDSQDDNVRKEAILAIGRFKDYGAVPQLIEMLRTPDEGLRVNVLWALKQITGKDFGYDVDAWLEWWDFYRREVEAKRKPPGDQGQPEGTPSAPATAARPPANEDGAGLASPERVRLWGFVALGALVLLLPIGWIACRWWLRLTMRRLLRVDPGTARDPAAIAMRFEFSDHMPDWIVYPFLARRMTKGSVAEVSVALNVLMFRLHGGCAENATSGGRLARATPIPGARDILVRFFPRGLLADMALAGYQAGRCLIRIAEPDNPVWQREATPMEKRTAERHIAAMVGKR